MKKCTNVFLAVVLVISIFSGCSGQNEINDANGSEAAELTEVMNKEGYPIVNEEVVFNFISNIRIIRFYFY